MRRLALLATAFLAAVVGPALAQTTQCGLDCAANDTATPLPPASLASAVAASDPAVQAELARVLALAQQAAREAAQAAAQLPADIADMQGRWALIQAQAAQGQAAAPPSQVPAVEAPP